MVYVEREVKILHIDTGLSWRGGQRQALILHLGLLKRNIESVIVCNQNGELYKKCIEDNVRGCIGFNYKKTFFPNKKEIDNILKLDNFSIIHCHDSGSASIGQKFVSKYILFHTRRVSYPINFLSRIFKYNKFSAHVCVSEDIRKYMNKFFKNCHTIHSCVELNRFNKRVNHEVFRKKGDLNFLFVGAFTEQKGIGVLIEAFSKVLQDFPGLVLHLVGRGELFSKVTQLTQRLGISDNVCFYGTRNDVEQFYQEADFVIVPSSNGEGSSGVIKEGMAAGKLIIASNLEANKELVDHMVNGLLFETDNSESLSNLMKEVVINKQLINSLEITRKIKEFDCQKTIESYIKLYKKYA
jgi:glycosyltransferase involved in cell wall biosynthesis